MQTKSDAPSLDAASAMPNSLLEAVHRLSRGSVLVVGDVMLDRWVHGDVRRISPEAPVAVMGVSRELDTPGGAGNVVRNLAALGAGVAFVSVVGDDQAGSDLTGLVGGQPGVEPWLLVQGGRTTTQKTRFVANGQQLLRTDREDLEPVHPKLAERLLRIAEEAMAATSVTLLSDYRKGVLAGEVGRSLVASARRIGRPIVVAMRGPDFGAYAGADVLLTGWRDLARSIDDSPVETDDAVARAALAMRQEHGIGSVIVVRAGFGLTVVTAANGAAAPVMHLRNVAAELVDGSGAGDTAVAVLAAAMASGVDFTRAAQLANLACSVAVGRVGTAVVRVRDLLAMLAPRPDAKLLSPEAAAERVERWRGAGLRTGFAQGEFASVSMHEGALLQQARAACDRLVVAVGRGQGQGQSEDAETQRPRAIRIAALPYVDLVVVPLRESPHDLLRALRPDLLVDLAPTPPETSADRAADRAADRPSGADLMRGWGGRLMIPADAAAEPPGLELGADI